MTRRIDDQGFVLNSFARNQILDALNERGMQNTAEFMASGFQCIKHNRSDDFAQYPIVELPPATEDGIRHFQEEYSINYGQLANITYRYALSNAESHPVVESFLTSLFAVRGCVVELPPPSSQLSELWPDVAWGIVISGAFLVHPAACLLPAPVALAHALRRAKARSEADTKFGVALQFYRSCLPSPPSHTLLRTLAQSAMAQGARIHPCVDLLLAKASQREKEVPSSFSHHYDIGALQWGNW